MKFGAVVILFFRWLAAVVCKSSRGLIVFCTIGRDGSGVKTEPNAAVRVSIAFCISSSLGELLLF